MSRKALLDQLHIPSPCNTPWESMIGNDQIRFCEHCNLSVHNLSEMTRKDAARLVAKSEGRLCVRYLRAPQGAENSPGRPELTIHRIGRRVTRLAAGTFSAVLGVSAAPLTASAIPQQRTVLTANQIDQDGLLSGTLVGTVKDANGALITSATVSITNHQTKLALYTSCNYQGEFRMEGLPAGLYSLRVEAPGFAPREQGGLYVQEKGETRLDLMLEVAAIEETVEIEGGDSSRFVSVGGVVAIIAPDDPLIRAAQQDELEEVTRLIAGRDVNLRDKSSHTTALEHAVRNANREMVQMLLAAGADVNAQNNAGETVLMMLDDDATSELIWDLLNAGAKVNWKDKEGNTPLLEAASCNNLELLKTLLETGAEVNAKNKLGQTALMRAAGEGLINNVRMLLLAGGDINARDKEGGNALFYANDASQSATVRFLRSQGADLTVAIEKKADDQ